MTSIMRAAPSILAGMVAATFQAQPQPPVFRAAVDVVRVPVRVEHDGQPVTNLTAGHFELRDNGVAQTLTSVTVTEHLNVSFVIDRSHSVTPQSRDRLRAVARDIASQLLDAEPASVLSFTDQPVIHLRMATDRRMLTEQLEAIGTQHMARTAIWDTVVAASGLMAGASGRPYVVVLTDGCDNASWATAPDINRWLSRLDITVDIAWFGSSRDEYRAILQTNDLCYGPLRLTDAVTPSGGRVFRTADRHILRDLTARLGDLRASYILSYTPTGVERNDGWHRIDVRLRNSRGRITARQSYFAGDR